MKKLLLILTICSTLAIASDQAALAPLQTGDFAAQRVVRIEQPTTFASSTQPVSMSWAVTSPVELNNTPHTADSRGYWLKVSAADFAEGISLAITQADALVRINPIAGPRGIDRQAAIDPMDLVLISNNGQAFSLGSGMDMLVSAENLEAAGGSMFGPGTSVFRLNANLGVGETLLYADNINYKSSQEYIIHVLEKHSDFQLSIQTGRDTYLAGDTLNVAAQLSMNGSNIAPGTLSGRIIAPNGDTYDLRFNRNGAALALDRNISNTPGLWQVEVTSTSQHNGLLIQRDARTAFAYAVPTALLNGDLSLTQSRAALSADLGVSVGSTGRYEVRGILFGQDAKGNSQALAVGQSAAWLEAGEASLTLSFDAALIKASNLKAPYTVKDLRLINQNTMTLLHRQTNGFTIAE